MIGKFFLFIFLSLFCFSSYGGACEQVFEKNLEQMSLFSKEHLDQIEKSQNSKQKEPLKNASLKTKQSENKQDSLENSILEEIRKSGEPALRVSRRKKHIIAKLFIDYFKSQDFENMERLVVKYPFLKSERFASASDLKDYIEKEDDRSFPMGWSPVQAASFAKDLKMLEFLLKQGFDIRSKKRQGGESLEDNPLHIAIKQNFIAGAKTILNHDGYINFGRRRNRLIDEKDINKHTPWFLAIKQDLKNENLDFIHLIGEYNPSGYVESFDWDGPKDGYELARKTGNSQIISLSYLYLKAPNYEYYKDIKRNSHSFNQKRTRHPTHYR